MALSWSPATDDVAVTGYDVSQDGAWLASVDTLSLMVGGLRSLESHTFSVAARVSAGNVGLAANATLVMPDLVAPRAPAAVSVTTATKTSVSIAWTAATDDVGVVDYVVSRDGSVLGTTTATTFDDTTAAPGVTYAYAVSARDAASNVGPASTASATTVEATPPTVGQPVPAVAAAGQLDTTAIPIVVSWSAQDVSGVGAVELQQSKNGGTWAAVTLPSATSTSVMLMRSPGNTFRYRARATDSVANTSAWAAGPTVTLSAKQEGSASITYGGTWTTVSTTSAYGGALKYATSSTATATLAFTGRSVAWVATRSPARGIADVYLDGVFAVHVDLYAASALPRSIAFARTFSAAGPHTLQIRVKGTVGRPRIDVDTFVLVN